MKQYKHLFFDLDRTLWDFDKSSYETFIDIYSKFKLKSRGIDEFENFLSVYKEHNAMLWNLYREGKLLKEKLRVLRFSLTLRDFGIEDENLVNQIAEYYENNISEKTILFPDVKETLDYLDTKYEIHIITNGFNEVQYKKLEKSGLAKYFKEVITSEEAGCLKPNKDIFVYALRKANASPYESLMIGDDITVDIIGAKSVGMDQVFFNPLKIENCEEITYEINSIKELMNIL